jgi:hypothetical protein
VLDARFWMLDGDARPPTRKRVTSGGGAIFNIVGHSNPHFGRPTLANNVEGGSSRVARSESRARVARKESRVQ